MREIYNGKGHSDHLREQTIQMLHDLILRSERSDVTIHQII